ncbi:dTMP kinase [Marinicella sp. W31]|uniref:dTMP kinase n=1 Tax=Marinicella sp. W31 TaxID=3023713 RepID=UPI003756394B
MKGRFITIEGSEGAGKSTAVKHIVETLEQRQVDHIMTREPGGEENGEKIRSILLDSEHLQANTELLLMFAARNEHLHKVIRPALSAGHWVLSDRFVDASYAYQSGGRGIDRGILDYLNHWIVADTQPDLTFLLDVDPRVGINRIAGRNHKDRIEQERIQFFENIRNAYLELAQQHPGRIVVIDANRPQSEVCAEVIDKLNRFIDEHA